MRFASKFLPNVPKLPKGEICVKTPFSVVVKLNLFPLHSLRARSERGGLANQGFTTGLMEYGSTTRITLMNHSEQVTLRGFSFVGRSSSRSDFSKHVVKGHEDGVGAAESYLKVLALITGDIEESIEPYCETGKQI